MCAACDTRRDAIEPKMRPLRALGEEITLDFGLGGIGFDIPDGVQEYVDGEPDPVLVRACGELYAGGWLAVEATKDTMDGPWGRFSTWQVRRFVRVTDRGEALDNLDLWAQMAAIEAQGGVDA